MNANLPIIIPAYQPDAKLIDLLKQLKVQEPKGIIVIVNDGSSLSCDYLFTKAEQEFNCIIIKHEKNLGKGAALKTAFKYCLTNLPNIKGVITADADGQHLVKDIYKIKQAILNNPDTLILGVRDFTKHKIPFRSRFGNVFTKYFLFFFIRNFINDTQTGLRGIPFSFLDYLSTIDGDGYEYEMNMLMVTQAQGVPIIEATISTVYIENNRDSHFNPVLDSVKIYWMILKFGMSSASSALVDFLIFFICMHSNLIKFYSLSTATKFGLVEKLGFNQTGFLIFCSLLIARISSVLFGFIVNYKVVFKARKYIVRSLFYYSLLAVSLFTCSFYGIKFLHFKFHINVLLAKVIVEMLLFILSFILQKKIIFKHHKV